MLPEYYGSGHGQSRLDGHRRYNPELWRLTTGSYLERLGSQRQSDLLQELNYARVLAQFGEARVHLKFLPKEAA